MGETTKVKAYKFYKRERQRMAGAYQKVGKHERLDRLRVRGKRGSTGEKDGYESKKP